MSDRVPWLLRWQARRALRDTFAAPAASALLDAAERHYASPPPIARTAGGRLNLQMAAYLLALRDALTESGFSPEHANGLLVDCLFRVMRSFNRLSDAIAVVWHPFNLTGRERVRQGLSSHLYFRRPDWIMVGVRGSRCFAFDVKRCLLADYMRGRGESEFCQQVFCSQDLLVAQSRDVTLVRTGTIASGARRCDFRYVDLIDSSTEWKPGA